VSLRKACRARRLTDGRGSGVTFSRDAQVPAARRSVG
jgi:hypothetical protein